MYKGFVVTPPNFWKECKCIKEVRLNAFISVYNTMIIILIIKVGSALKQLLMYVAL